jgi:hypothetical protein
MREGTPIRGQIKVRHAGSKFSPLSNWPRYPGGVMAGALAAVVSIVIFVVDIPALRDYLRAAQMLVVVLWALGACRSDD